MVFIFCGSLGKLIQGLSLWCRQKIRLWHLGNLWGDYNEGFFMAVG